jgi:hypothetical protein
MGEVTEQLQAHCLTLFGMKLNAAKITMRDHRGVTASILCFAHYYGTVFGFAII